MALKHAWQSEKTDGADATQLQPSNWNEEHKATTGLDMGVGAVVPPGLYQPTGFVGFTKRVADRGLMGVAGNSWQSLCQPSLFGGHVGIWQPAGGSTTVPGVHGIEALSATGTATSRSWATTNRVNRQKRLGYVSATSAGSLAGHRQTVKFISTANASILNGGGFFYACRFSFSDAAYVAGARAFVGLTSSTSAPTNVEPSTLTNCIGIAQLSSDDTQLYLVYGGSSPQTPIALGTNFAPSQGSYGYLYDLYLASHPGNQGVSVMLVALDTGDVYEYFQGSADSAISPNSSTSLGHRAWRCNNATALAVGIDIGSVYIEGP